MKNFHALLIILDLENNLNNRTKRQGKEALQLEQLHHLK